MNISAWFISALVFFVLSWQTVFGSDISPDNTRINQRDTEAGQVTADQQGMSKSDAELTQKIRWALVRDRKLSIYARNIKIISIDGMVTLKGPVRSPAEKRLVVRKARNVAGKAHVNDQIDVVTQN